MHKGESGTWETRTGFCLCRESEGLILALKPGNAGGAKGPQRNMYLSMREDPLERMLHYG